MRGNGFGSAKAGCLILFPLLLFGAPPPTADGWEDLREIQKLRVALMKNNARQMADIFAKLRGGRVKEARANAETLALHGRLIPRLSPKGSDAPPTRARPAIWENFEDFSRKAKAMSDAARELAAIVKKGDTKAAIRQFKALAKACESCHRSYRAKKKPALSP